MTIGTIDYWFLIRSIRLRAIALSVFCVSIFSCKCINVVLFASRRTAHARSRCINNSSVTFNFVGINQSAYVTVLDFSVFLISQCNNAHIWLHLLHTHTLQIRISMHSTKSCRRRSKWHWYFGRGTHCCRLQQKVQTFRTTEIATIDISMAHEYLSVLLQSNVEEKNQQHLIIVSLLEASRNYYSGSRHNSCLCVVSTSFTEQIALKNWVFFSHNLFSYIHFESSFVCLAYFIGLLQLQRVQRW